MFFINYYLLIILVIIDIYVSMLLFILEQVTCLSTQQTDQQFQRNDQLCDSMYIQPSNHLPPHIQTRCTDLSQVFGVSECELCQCMQVLGQIQSLPASTLQHMPCRIQLQLCMTAIYSIVSKVRDHSFTSMNEMT